MHKRKSEGVERERERERAEGMERGAMGLQSLQVGGFCMYRSNELPILFGYGHAVSDFFNLTTNRKFTN